MNSSAYLESLIPQTIASVTPQTPAVAQAVLQGLSHHPKYLPSWLFYDAEGSRLFEAITSLPEYYLTHLEQAIFVQHAACMIAAAAGLKREHLSVLELGAGSASKTIVLLRALIAHQGQVTYTPVDVSEAALQWARRNIHAALPEVLVQPVRSEFTH
ncbi:MAG TPA: L-histidine N(alpha)-methyltransferase, partial [Acidobacteriaceae bacterium]|nr:L-histidine N(alpha)-methyltransferase [Acidobacteriaceae bacterium]